MNHFCSWLEPSVTLEQSSCLIAMSFVVKYMAPLSVNHPCPTKSKASLIWDLPARWSRARRTQAAVRFGQVEWTGFPKKKKYCSGLVPVRTLCPALSNATSKSGFSATKTHWNGDLETIVLETAELTLEHRCAFHSGIRAMQKLARRPNESTAMQTAGWHWDRRAHLLQDCTHIRCFWTSLHVARKTTLN